MSRLVVYFRGGARIRSGDFAMPNEILYTVEEVARQLNVHPETVRKWIKSGELRAIKLGGPAGYRISQSAYDQFLREREEARQRGGE